MLYYKKYFLNLKYLLSHKQSDMCKYNDLYLLCLRVGHVDQKQANAVCVGVSFNEKAWKVFLWFEKKSYFCKTKEKWDDDNDREFF